MSKNIPDRWIPYKAYGKVIEGTRIVCFKVPLRKGFQEHNKDIKEIWDIQTLLDKLPNLGAVVDLTNTARYYNPGELRDAGVLHKKILMPGRVIPPENKVTEFMDTIDEFLGKDCDIIIGVHCTHGLNRTGYMVCRYMRDRLGIQAEDAIARFEEARGYKIERENYLAHLLGKEVPPPDVGKKRTMLKPLDDQEAESEHLPKPRYKNRWRHNKRSADDNKPELDNRPGYDQRHRNDIRPGNHKRPKNDNRPEYDNRPGYNNRSGYHNRPRFNNRSEFIDRPRYDSRPGYNNNQSGTERGYEYRFGSDSRLNSDNQPPFYNQTESDNVHADKSMQYRSPLDQCEDTESHQPERQPNGFRSRFNYNPYSRNRDDTHKNNASNTSGTSSSRWDMSGMSHRPRKPKE